MEAVKFVVVVLIVLWSPVCPDASACYPFYEMDPFVVSEPPHVLFSGGASAFATSAVANADGCVRLVSVPKFSSTGCAVVVDLTTLAAEPICFGSSVMLSRGDEYM